MDVFNITYHRHHHGRIIFSTPAKTYEIGSHNLKQSLVGKHWSGHKIYRPVPKQFILLIGSGSGILFQEPNPPSQEETFLSYMFWQKLLCITPLRNWADFVDS